MRERTTWNREQIAKLAAGKRVAEDPRAMNQDHLSQQPAADKYDIGGPSDFAEDVHPSAGTWKAEYSGGEVKRNELGMPEFRSDTFNHPEKTAGQQEADDEEDEEFLEKKAEVCLKLASKMLPKTASAQAVEDQALAFMHMPNSAVVETALRLAQDEEQGQDQGQQQKQAQQDQGSDDQGQGQQQKQAQGQQDQGSDDKDQAQQKQAQQDQDDKEQAQQKQAQQAQQEQDDADKAQQKQANDLVLQACQAFQQGNPQAAQQAIQQMVQATLQGQPVQSQEQMQQISQQIQQMVQQAFQQQLGQGQQQPAAQQPMAQQQQIADDQLLDQMIQQQVQQQPVMASATSPAMDIQLEGPGMDTGEVHLGSEDEALTALFASHTEVREAAQANALQTGIPVTAGSMGRTAAVRTLGTRPSNGVSQLGGGTHSPAGGGNEIDKLSGLWTSAPSLKGVFDS